MLTEIVSFIDQEKLDLDAIQIAEALWFMEKVSVLIPEIEESKDPEKTSELEYVTEDNNKPDNKKYADNKLVNLEKLEPERNFPITQSSSESSSIPKTENTSSPLDKLPIKLPDTGIVTNTLELGRLFKPLKKKVNSRTVQELNVKETVKKSAELSTPKTPLYFPVLTPKKERWLDIALIIEKSESMILWQPLLKEVKEFLEHLGAFRDIKTYGMNWNQSTETLHITSFESLCQFLSPQQLNDPSGRRLVLIISDCISNAWNSQEFIKIMQQWSSKGLLTLLNPFPETMWERTNIDYGIKLRLGNQKKGLPSQNWQAIPLASWQVKGLSEQVLINLVKLPIINLESTSIESWVNVIMGKGISWCSGVWLGSNFIYEEEEEDDENETMTPLQQINNFYATSSQIAWKLIQWLSAIPVSFSTIRLVQRTLLPESTQVHVAEVVMGGLLSRTKPINQNPSLTTAYYQSPHDIQFEFKPGIRESLLEHLEIENGVHKKDFCLGVIGSLTEKIASHFGYQTIREFEATLLNLPLQLTGDDDLELIQAFATISVSTLRQYGAEYAPYIKKLDKSRARLNLVSTVEGDDPVFNWIDFLESIARRYHLTDIETETLINLFPTPNQSYSIREVAKQLFISPSAISSRLTNIYRKFETLNTNLFQSKKHNKLSTLQRYLYSQYVKVRLL
ncbi:SAV_2336 N-terminal domain-related protein [Crocosphaera sp.]|uniref:SAV_2336 N-terminal domain-related protein n=1 Tax=Crocosphaera sp. TaxID=2729996 RepID=UPI002632039C|nr:SAV_2336 N-terminal domain-related protein [Crocosphaera sp.]MDJ0583160.1 SAV_2336 N-terminal domain-related protein [Crocosphaera sp.]